ELAVPSLYDESLRYLDRCGVHVPDEVLARAVSTSHVRNEGVIEAWRPVSSDPERWWSLYELAEKLVDMEDYFRRWRFNPATTAEPGVAFSPARGGTAA